MKTRYVPLPKPDSVFTNEAVVVEKVFDHVLMLVHGLDWKYLDTEIKKLEFADYEKNCRELSLDLFNGKRLNDREKELLDYYIFSGTYGNTENLVENQLEKTGGGFKAKIRYFADRFFVPLSKKNPMYKAYKVQYPAFYKNKLLLPFLPFYRLFHSLKTSRRRILTEIKALVKF